MIAIVSELWQCLKRIVEMWFGGMVVLVDTWIEFTKWAFAPDDHDDSDS